MNEPEDVESIREFFDLFSKMWGVGDGLEVGGLFTDDGTLVNPFGQRADGRQAVTAMYAEFFSGMLAGTTTSVSLEHVRSVDASHALVDGEQTILGADGAVLLVAHLVALLRRDGDRWSFLDSRPYLFASPAGGTA